MLHGWPDEHVSALYLNRIHDRVLIGRGSQRLDCFYVENAPMERAFHIIAV